VNKDQACHKTLDFILDAIQAETEAVERFEKLARQT
jgi:hypothetical protein